MLAPGALVLDPEAKVRELEPKRQAVPERGELSEIVKPDAVSAKDWAKMSPSRRTRCVLWHDLDRVERRLLVKDAVLAYLTWQRDEVERRKRLDVIVAARKQAKRDEAEPPRGAAPSRPQRKAIWNHRVYDYMADRFEWVTLSEMVKHFGVNHASVFSGVRMLMREGLAVEGPAVVTPSGRRAKQFQLARE